MEKHNCSVIVLSYNTKRITDQCLQHLKKALKYSQDKLGNEVEVIFVENGSSDGSLEMIKRKHGWAKLINLKENVGYAKGNNIGMSKAKYDFLLLLNSDAYVKKKTIVKGLKYFKNNKKCDLLGCKLTFANGKLQPSGGYLPTPINTIWWMTGVDKLPALRNFLKPIHPKHTSFFAKDKKLEWVMGAFLLMKRSVYEKTGGFDDEFFMYMEEVEWCHRMKNSEVNICYTPKFSITHLDKASSNFELRKPLTREIQGLLYFHKTHYKRTYPFVRLVIYLGCLVRHWAYLIIGNNYMAKTYKEILKLI